MGCLAFAGATGLSNVGPARAGPGGVELLPVAMTAQVGTSTAVSYTVVVTGWLDVARIGPRLEDGRQVFDLTALRADLIGGSALGAVTVSERADQGGLYASRGEVRAMLPDAQFPATTSLDLYIDAEAPNSQLGPLSLHNEEALHLAPLEGGTIDAWPPFGVTYGLALSSGECVPLLNPDKSVHLAGFCIEGLTMEVAPLLPSFSVARDGPRRLHPADILSLAPKPPLAEGQMPFVRLTCAELGLTADGCDDGTDGDQDDIDALSYGHDLAGTVSSVYFSVGPGAQGLAGTGVQGQTLCPGLASEPEPDVFASSLDGSNSLLLDGNGPVGRCTPAFPLGLVEGFSVRDDLDAFEAGDVATVDTDGDGVPNEPVYFSLDGDSPSLAALGFRTGDVLSTRGGETAALYASATALGLGPDDDVDALCLAEDGDSELGEGDRLYISLAAGSPSLASLGAAGGDVLGVGPLRIVSRGQALGLAAGDELDALACEAIAEGPAGDVDCNFIVNSIDALLILQYNSGLTGALPCMGGADIDGNGGVDSADAARILQTHAGLLTRLPPHEAGEVGGRS